MAYFTKRSAIAETGMGALEKRILNEYTWSSLAAELWVRKYSTSTESWDNSGANDGWYKATTITNASSDSEVSFIFNNNSTLTDGINASVSGPSAGQKFQLAIRFTGRPSPLLCVVLKSIKVEGAWHEDKDQDLETKVYEVAADSNTNFSTFTGKHRCVVEGSIPEIGMLVSSTGKYDNVNYQHEDEKESDRRYKVNPQEAVPVVVTTTVEKDKKVLGVLCRLDKKSRNNSYFRSNAELNQKSTIPRYDICLLYTSPSPRD